MNWLYLLLGMPCGVLLGLIGAKLAKKTRNSTLKIVAEIGPLLFFVLVIIIVDVVM